MIKLTGVRRKIQEYVVSEKFENIADYEEVYESKHMTVFLNTEEDDSYSVSFANNGVGWYSIKNPTLSQVKRVNELLNDAEFFSMDDTPDIINKHGYALFQHFKNFIEKHSPKNN